MTVDPVLRLATWNIHMGIGADGERNLARTAAVIGEIDPDLIGLQEVDNSVDRDGDDLQRLESMTGLHVVAGPTMARGSGDYGNALLTHLPVLDVERYDISVDKREPRGILIVHLDWAGTRLQVAVTHLGLLPRERRRQVRRLIECLSVTDRTPLILMGDFNEWLFWGRPLRWLRRHFGQFRSPATFPARWPLLRLDHILTNPPDCLVPPRLFRTAGAIAASDHLPLVANYRLCRKALRTAG
ncbi:MAG: endonuclease/exonuclease/phosphatase family protein [Desulfuromonadales bacterium]|nr:endonuclease/exonuclease/phosphatase family protein [Desulfuromonadales bacterium]